MSVEVVGSIGKGFSAEMLTLDSKVAMLISVINEEIAGHKGQLSEKARSTLQFIGEKRLGPDMIKLLIDARGYTQMAVVNQDYTDASTTVLYKKGSEGFSELLVDNSSIAAIICPEEDRRNNLNYLAYLKIERNETDRYMHHIRTMTGNMKRSAWSLGKKEGVTVAIASGAVASGASGQGEMAICLGGLAVFYYLGANAWQNFQLSRAYDHITTLAHGEEREVGIAALVRGLGSYLKVEH